MAFDTDAVASGASHTFFSVDRAKTPGSGAHWTEQEIVRWLARQETPRQLLWEVLGLPDTVVCMLEVTGLLPARMGKSPSELDFIACAPLAPSQCMAIEWKRVKVQVSRDGPDQVNKVDRLDDGESQVRGIVGAGFNQCYFGIAVVVDAREASAQNFPCKGLSQQTHERIVEVATSLSFPAEAGILYVEIVQPVSSSLHQAAVVSAGLLRTSVRREQPVWLTERVLEHMRRSHAR